MLTGAQNLLKVAPLPQPRSSTVLPTPIVAVLALFVAILVLRRPTRPMASWAKDIARQRGEDLPFATLWSFWLTRWYLNRHAAYKIRSRR